MRVKWFRSATVGIISDTGSSILCDPWITDGAFIGSWYHWPPLEGFEFKYLVEQKWDAIYVSHFHADHFDRKLLAAIMRNQPEIFVIIPTYSKKWLKRAILNCGIKEDKVIEIPNNKVIGFKDFKITMFVADYCNPTICGSAITCGSTPRNRTANDSVALFESDGQRILNANDALAVQTAQKIWPLIGEIDLLLGHYGGAGPYPQCFIDIDSETKIEKARITGHIFVDRLIKTADILKAKFTMPYAGQYVLGGSLSVLNKYRSVIPLEEVLLKIKDSRVSNPISLMPFSEFDLTNPNLDNEWKEPSTVVLNEYIKKISLNLYPYQKVENDWSDIKSSLDRALTRVKAEIDLFLLEGGNGSESSITIKTANIKTSLNIFRKKTIISENPIFENSTEIKVDQRLLKRMIVRRPNYSGFTQYHFNQAEIGSHLEWARVGPYPIETQFLNFMQDA
jgi:UDP-MurNAc hydroxylase